MLKVSEARVGLPVFVEVNGSSFPGVIMIIDYENDEFGVKETHTHDTRIYPAEKVRARYPCNNQQPGSSTLSLKEKNLLHLLGGYIITLAKEESSPPAAKEVAKMIQKAGIAQIGTKAQDLIAVMQ